MAKPFNKCKLCNAPKFLNFAGLCKRCNNKKEGLAIAEAAVIEQQAHYAEDDKARAEAAEIAAEAEAAEPVVEEGAEGAKEGADEKKDAKKE